MVSWLSITHAKAWLSIQIPSPFSRREIVCKELLDIFARSCSLDIKIRWVRYLDTYYPTFVPESQRVLELVYDSIVVSVSLPHN